MEFDAIARSAGFDIQLPQVPDGVRIIANVEDIAKQRLVVDVTAAPAQADTLNAVIPWSDQRYHYMSKQIGRSVLGRIRLGDSLYQIDDTWWGVMDYGRGEWPYSISWNRVIGYGDVSGRKIGLNLGAR